MSDGAPEHFEKWWQGVKLGGFMNDEIMPAHVREAFDLGVLFEREACAKIAETFADQNADGPSTTAEEAFTTRMLVNECKALANTIRNRN